MPIKSCNFTLDQRDGIAERIVDHVDSTSYDWQLESDDEHNEAITWWADILREMGFDNRADKLERDYSI